MSIKHRLHCIHLGLLLKNMKNNNIMHTLKKQQQHQHREQNYTQNKFKKKRKKNLPTDTYHRFQSNFDFNLRAKLLINLMCVGPGASCTQSTIKPLAQHSAAGRSGINLRPFVESSHLLLSPHRVAAHQTESRGHHHHHHHSHIDR